MNGLETMLALSRLPEAFFISRNELDDREYIYEGRLVADQTNWVFYRNGVKKPENIVSQGSYTTAWRAVSKEPLIAGVSVKDRQHLIVERRPEGDELTEWYGRLKEMDSPRI